MTQTLRAMIPGDVSDLPLLQAEVNKAIAKAMEHRGATPVGDIQYVGVHTEPVIIHGTPINMGDVTLHAFEIQANVPVNAA